jgi:ketosteroid isomerase-like protein
MAAELEALTRQIFEALDRKDAESIIAAAADDVQGVDEVSRRWIRGIDALGNYVRELMSMVSNVHSTISDAHETVAGDVGIVTCWLEQDYVAEGRPQHVSAPTTLVFRRDGGTWKMWLLQSVPLPPEDA